jgi:nucleoside-diphosphate-sugar epimerase
MPLELRDARILITGPTGQVALPLALALARQNKVIGVARFSDAKLRERLEAGGVRCIATDLGTGELGALPREVDFVLNLAVARSATPDFDGDLRSNAEAAGLLLSHCRRARAFLHCSTTGVYEADGHHVFREDSPLGDNHRVMSPTYSIAKIAAEAVVRYAAREFGVPTVIARLDTPYGDNGGWPWYHLLMMRGGAPIPVHVDRPSQYTLIHEDDILASLPRLLGAASVPASIFNWCGSEHVSIEEWTAYLGELTGLEPKLNYTEATLESVMADNSKLCALGFQPQVHWRDGLRRMVAARAPELLRSR